MALEKKDNGNTWIADDWDEMGFNLKGRDHAAHDIKVLCPACSETRKNRRDPCVSIRPLDGIANCKNCGTVFLIRKEKKEYVKVKADATPLKPINVTKVSDAGVEYLRGRRITQEAIVSLKLGEKNGSIAFPFIFKGDCVNVKYRAIADKKFFQEMGGYHILYNYDMAMAAPEKKLIITEGEIDTASWVSSGIKFATSLDSGAPNPADRSIEGKFECITNSFELIDRAKIVYIATDNDENGKIAEKELIRRIGVEKCKLIDFAPYKDSNEYLMYEGVDGLRGLLDKAQDPKVEGVFTAKDFYHGVMDLYTNGLTKGSTTYMPSIDEGWKWRMGEVNVWTGYNNEGKSKLLRYLEMLKAKYDGWKMALFIPEDMPQAEWFEDMCHMYIGKSLDPDDNYRATPEEVNEAMAFMEAHFFIVYPDKEFTLDTLFEKFRYLIRRYGVRVVDIDPYNTVEHLYGKGMTTDLYISFFMGALKRFAVENSVAFNVVFHQNPPDSKNADGTYPPPRKYRMKGGGTISDKADNVLGVWRPRRQIDFKDPTVTFLTEKIKKQKYTGKADMQIDIEYDYLKNRYVDLKLNRMSPLEIPLNYL
jgi:twinkle protein